MRQARLYVVFLFTLRSMVFAEHNQGKCSELIYITNKFKSRTRAHTAGYCCYSSSRRPLRSTSSLNLLWGNFWFCCNYLRVCRSSMRRVCPVKATASLESDHVPFHGALSESTIGRRADETKRNVGSISGDYLSGGERPLETN